IHDTPAAVVGAARGRRGARRPHPDLGRARGSGGHRVGPRPGPHQRDGRDAMTDACEFTPPADACALPGTTGSDPAHAGRTWQGPGAGARLGILRRARSIAIVGASNNPARASYFVATYLLSSSPYDVYFVNPRAD